MITVEIAKHAKAFHQAHCEVVEYLGGTKFIMETMNHFGVLKRGWKEFHNVEVAGAVGSWMYMTFASEEEYLLWVLKYGTD